MIHSMKDIHNLYMQRLIAVKAQPVVLDTEKLSLQYNPKLKNYNIEQLIQRLKDLNYTPCNGHDFIKQWTRGDDMLTDTFIQQMKDNREAMIFISIPDDDVSILFYSHEQVMDISVIDQSIIDKPFKILKYKNKKDECEICNDISTNFFRSCVRCKKECCNNCFKSMLLKDYKCPYCRFTLNQQILDYYHKHSDSFDYKTVSHQ